MGTVEDLASACPQTRPAGESDLVDGIQPTLVASPSSTEETAAVLQVARAHGLSVVARGNGTKLTWGVPPSQVDLIVDMARMDRVVEHAAGDLIVVAEAGVALGDLNKQLSSEGQCLALDEMVAGSTVGGVVATSASGPGRMSTGTVRDLLIGVTMVRADGVVAKSGGKVVKNVAGYDLGKLLIGSYGTLGVITQAAFRLHPLPVANRWVQVSAGTVDAVGAAAASILGSQLVPAALEVDWRADGSGMLAVELAGTEAGVQTRAESVARLLGPAAETTDRAPTWMATYPWSAGDIGLKLTCQLSAVSEVLTAARSAEARLDVRGSAGVGVLYGGLPHGTESGTVKRVVERLREVCTSRGGSVIVIDAPADIKTALDSWGPVDGLDLMRRVKNQFDPDHRLAPGRFVGGI